VSYKWTWGDGRSESHVGATAKKTYAVAGTYSVMLTVTDGSGQVNSVTKSVQVPTTTNTAPTASITAPSNASSVAQGTTAPDHHDHHDERTTMGIIAFIILGLLAGIIAKAILPGNDPGGLIITTIIGIVGALLGGFLAAALFDAHPLDEFFDLSTWITAIVGSIILLAIYRAVMNRGGQHRLT